jgi:predicted nucleic acid-binding protein
MMTLLFNTSVFICHLRGEDPRCSDYMQQVASGTLGGLVSVLTLTELYAGEQLSDDDERILDALILPFQAIDVDADISVQAGRLVRRWRRSHGIGVVDLLIAATALVEEVPILTLNAKRFYFIPGLVVVNPVAG